MSTCYTPEIKDFHIGFECEILTANGWHLETLDVFLLRQIILNWEDHKTDIRVKYLDKEDIESLGWEFSESAINRIEFRNEKIGYGLNLFNDKHMHIFNTWESITYFNGTIRNKSELKILMKWLNI